MTRAELRDAIVSAVWEKCGGDDERAEEAADDVMALLDTGPLWRHVKTGGEYREVCRPEVQLSRTDLHPSGGITEGDVLVVYQSAQGRCWARYEPEFLDGRFVAIDADDPSRVVG